MSRLARASIPTPTATPTTCTDASGPVVTDPPRLVPIDLEIQRPKRRALKDKRQDWPNTCGNVGNDVLSCYPTDNTTVVQGGYTRFVWNYRYPEYIGYGLLDIYLFHADSGIRAASWTSVANYQEWVGVTVNDQFWGTRGVSGWQDGRNQTMPFYFVAVSAGASLDGGEPRQATFTAVQTRLPDYYSQSLSSVASMSSLASISRTSAASVQSTASLSSVVTATGTVGPGTGTGGLQNGAGNSSFPKWAIALLVILGALALAALMLLAWLSARNLRTRQRRHSTGSSTPIMAAPNQTQPESTISPVEHPPASIVGRPVSLRRGGSLINANDGASTRSGETGPISGQDAAIMASAFRAMMRKPDFANRPDEEDESPEEKNAREMKEQLAEEGRDIQSVRSERGVRVHNTAEDGSEDGWGPAASRR